MELQKEISELRDAAKHFRQRADELDEKAFRMQKQMVEKAMTEQNDKLINRTRAIELLWFTTHQSLKDWENKMSESNLDYLQFQDNKILRSEVIRFRDDYYDGTVHNKLRVSQAGG